MRERAVKSRARYSAFANQSGIGAGVVAARRLDGREKRFVGDAVVSQKGDFNRERSAHDRVFAVVDRQGRNYATHDSGPRPPNVNKAFTFELYS